MSLPRYAEYKESGVEWLGRIPSHWSAPRLKTLLEETDERAGRGEAELLGLSKSLGVVKRAELEQGAAESDDYSKYKIVHPGQLVMNKMQAWNGVFGLSANFGKVSPDYATFQFFQTDLGPYLTALFRTDAMAGAFFTRCRGMGTAFLRLNTGDFLDVKVPLPPPSEVPTIAAFLDRETAKIDALIAEQEKLIALLAEKRHATISHAVTKGLNSNAPMKDSGLALLGEVPAHWTVCALRRMLMRIEQGWSPDCFSRPAEGSEWGVLKTGCVNGGIFNPSENKALPDTLKPDPSIEVCDGDLIMSRASGSPALVGSMAYVEEPPSRLMLSDKIFRLHLRQDVLSRFFAIVFSARYMRLQIEQAISGAEGLANNLPQFSLKGFKIAIPPEAEQVELITFVEIEMGKLRALSSEAERAIALLKERRSALVSAAVTGQIDVRSAVSQAAVGLEAIAA